MSTHIKILGWIRIIYGIFGVLGALAMFASGLFGGLFSGSLGGTIGGILAGTVGGVIIGVLSLFGIATGFGLLQRQQWARFVTIILSILDLFRFPFGTILGVYGLWVLLSSEGASQFATPGDF